MKYKIYTIWYLLIMFLYLARPIMPYLIYEIKKEYISENICVRRNDPNNNCHGRCHLKEQIEKNSENGDANRDSNKTNVQNNKIEDHLKSGEILIIPYEAGLKPGSNLCKVFRAGFLTPVFIPPEKMKDYLINEVQRFSYSKCK